MVQVSAWTGPRRDVLRLTFPDGTVVEDEVWLTTPSRPRSTVGRRSGHIVDGPWAAALSAFVGRPVTLVRCDRPGGTRAGNPVSLVGDGSLDGSARSSASATVDARRFRMLIELEGAEPHEEDTWIGGRIALGKADPRSARPTPAAR